MIIIGLILMVLLFGGMIFGTVTVLKKTDPKQVDTSLRDDITTAQEFMPFVDLKDSMIHLGNHDYRAVLECTSINFDLKTEKEQQIIKMVYTQFLNSLTFPITIFIATREIDNAEFTEKLKVDYEDVIGDFPSLAEYADQNFKDMQNLNHQLGVTRHKKKYIIIEYNEANLMTMQNDEEKYAQSGRELANRARVIEEGLMNLGVKTTALNTRDLIDLMVRTYHRNGKSHSEQIWNKDFTSMIVEGGDSMTEGQLSSDEKLDVFISGLEEKLKSDIFFNDATTSEGKMKADEVFKELRKIRKGLSKNFLTDEQKKYNNELYKDELKWEGEVKNG